MTTLISDAVPQHAERSEPDIELHGTSGPTPTTPAWVVEAWEKAREHKVENAKLIEGE